MSESAFYILLSLASEKHGYAVMQDVEAMTAGRIRLGAGTVYGTLGKMEKQALIKVTAEEDRRKVYRLTTLGKRLLRLEIRRLEELVRNAQPVKETIHG
jgi:DNA-binding PadR family transcriptional regulator